MSSCVYGSEGVGPAHYWVGYPIARKTHVCCSCNQEIKPGDKYENYSGIWDANFQRFKTCSSCQEIRDKLFCDGWVFEAVWEDLKYSLEESIPWSAIGKLSEISRNRVLDLIEELWEEEALDAVEVADKVVVWATRK
jgi:hypothetical protein